ncbi:MAG: glycosyltransferase family 2 protein, partial [Nitrososphaera sp.]|nr:glycosyltransferase family 2 protein [Nitrososphaera sp.]
MTLREQGLSIVHPFYDDFSRLPFHYDVWKKYRPESMEKLNFVLVDDCSARPLMGALDVSKLENNLHVFRIQDDLRWNTCGALNLGITQAPDEWVVCMDSDCMLFPEYLEKLLDESPDPDKFYYFKRIRLCEQWPEKKLLDRYLPCAILMTKTAFLKIGGFDEDFTGAYTGGYGFFDTDLENKIKAQGLRMQYNDIR